MTTRAAAIWERLRSGLWFVPSLMVMASMLLAWGALQVDTARDLGPVWWLNQGNWASVTDFLSSLLGALITMATVAVSITVVVLTLAAAQLGPRLIRSFMGDLRTQLVLGLFFGTIVYLVVILSMLDTDVPKHQLPHVAVTVGTALVLACVGGLLFYVHHLARSIIADTVIVRVGNSLDDTIRKCTARQPGNDERALELPSGPPAILSLEQSGYVQAIDFECLAQAAGRCGATISLGFRAGQHLLSHRSHGQVWPPERYDDDLRSVAARSVILGHERMDVQDIEFGFRQLVEVALRALSPGINDPFTAISVIDRMSASMATWMERSGASGVWRDDRGRVLLVVPVVTFEGIMDVAWNQLRQTARGDHPAVLIRIMDNLSQLAEGACTPDQVVVVQRHVDLLMETGRRGIGAACDLEALEDRHRRATHILTDRYPARRG